MAQQIWIRRGDEVEGPFTAAVIRKMAADGTITPQTRISKDREKWSRAEKIKGLVFASRTSQTEGPAKPPRERERESKTGIANANQRNAAGVG